MAAQPYGIFAIAYQALSSNLNKFEFLKQNTTSAFFHDHRCEDSRDFGRLSERIHTCTITNLMKSQQDIEYPLISS